jgi:hypothetical protein
MAKSKSIKDVKKIPNYFGNNEVKIYLKDEEEPFKGIILNTKRYMLTLKTKSGRVMINIAQITHIITPLDQTFRPLNGEFNK